MKLISKGKDFIPNLTLVGTRQNASNKITDVKLSEKYLVVSKDFSDNLKYTPCVYAEYEDYDENEVILRKEEISESDLLIEGWFEDFDSDLLIENIVDVFEISQEKESNLEPSQMSKGEIRAFMQSLGVPEKEIELHLLSIDEKEGNILCQ